MNLRKFLFFLAVLAAVSVFLHFSSEKFPDPDVFYHFRHADLYWQNSLADSGFSRIPYSVISKFSSDIWYGFHLFLIPFTGIEDEIFGLRLAGAVITLAALLIFYWAIVRAGISWPYFWPFLLLFSSPFVLYRFTMLRPHILSLALSALFFVFAFQSSFWGVFLTSFFIALLHLSLFWAPILIFGVLAAVKFSSEKVIDWRSGVALALGLLFGWVLRPNPLGSTKIAYTQIVDLFLAKQGGVPLNFGMELFTMPVSELVVFLPFITLWLLAGAIFIKVLFAGAKPATSPRNSSFLWASFFLSILFFLMTIFIAQRSFDFWVMFGVLFISFVFSYFLPQKMAYKYVLGAVFVIMLVHGLYNYAKYTKQFGWDIERFRPASEWIKNNSNQDEIVFNVAWEYFPELFFWNAQNRYISGMDPIFQYVYDSSLYWKAHYLETGKTTSFTCASTFCEEKDFEDTHAVLKNDFKASFVALSRPADENLYKYLLTDPRFSLGYEDSTSAVFKIK